MLPIRRGHYRINGLCRSHTSPTPSGRLIETMVKLLLRRALPKQVIIPLRAAYRIFKSFSPPPVSLPFPPELVTDCRFCASRLDMLSFLPHQATVAELGTEIGNFAREIVIRTNPRELHLIDFDYSRFDPSGLPSDRVMYHRGDTGQILANFPPDFFDWIYVDADHSFEGVQRDIRSCADKVKPGGLLVFNDFAHIDPSLGRYGVHRAVMEFVNEARWKLRFFAYEVSGLYDVAIQRPDAEWQMPQSN